MSSLASSALIVVVDNLLLVLSACLLIPLRLLLSILPFYNTAHPHDSNDMDAFVPVESQLKPLPSIPIPPLGGDNDGNANAKPMTTTSLENEKLKEKIPGPTKLSVDSRIHLSRIIGNALTETGVTTSEEGKDAWTRAILGALDELGASIMRGDWLVGIKSALEHRRMQNRHNVLDVIVGAAAPTGKTTAGTGKKNTATTTTANAAGNSSGNAKRTVNTSEQSTTSSSTEDVLPAPPQKISFPTSGGGSNPNDVQTTSSSSPEHTLSQIRSFLSKPLPPSPLTNTQKHLLLCVAPLGSRIAVPPSIVGSKFELVPGSVGCTFAPNLFPLTEMNSDAVLCGLRGWDAYESSQTPSLKIIGGTFLFKGITSPSQHTLLLKVMHIAVYLHLSLILEQHFLLDSCVPLSYPPPPPITPPPGSPGAGAMTRHMSHEHTHQQGPKMPHPRNPAAALIPSGILSLFSKKAHRTSLSSTSSSNPSNPSNKPPKGSPLSPTSSGRGGGGSLDITREPTIASVDTGNHFRRFSFISSAVSPPSSYSHAHSSHSSSPSIGGGTDARMSLLSALSQHVTSKDQAKNSQKENDWVQRPFSNTLALMKEHLHPPASTPPTLTISAPTSTTPPSTTPTTAIAEGSTTPGSLLSSSPCICYDPPGILVRLARKEDEIERLRTGVSSSSSPTSTSPSGPTTGVSSTSLFFNNSSGVGGVGGSSKPAPGAVMRLSGDEKAALGSVKGWGSSSFTSSSSSAAYSSSAAPSGGGEKDKDREKEREREERGKALVGMRGFVRMQELSVLVVGSVPCPGTGTLDAGSSAAEASLGKDKEPIQKEHKDKEKDAEKDGDTPTASSITATSSSSSDSTVTPKASAFTAISSSVASSSSAFAGAAGGAVGGAGDKAEDSEKNKKAVAEELQSQTRPSSTVSKKEDVALQRGGSKVVCIPPTWMTYRFYASYPGQSPASPIPSTSTSASSSTSATPAPAPTSTSTSASPPSSSRGGAQAQDVHLGDAISELGRTAWDSCERPGCRFRKGEHEWGWVHDGWKVCVNVDDHPSADAGDAAEGGDDEKKRESGIRMWCSCRVCGKKTVRKEMSDGTFLLSFAKFIELLIYSPMLCEINPALCEHTASSGGTPGTSSTPVAGGPAGTELPCSRLNIRRHFSIFAPPQPHSATTSSSASASPTHKPVEVIFSLEKIEDVFEVRVPRIQIQRGYAIGGHAQVASSVSTSTSASTQSVASDALAGGDRGEGTDDDDPKKVLRKEILTWFQNVAEYMDKLEELFARDDNAAAALVKKSLPRLPSQLDDDDYDLVGDTSFGLSGGLDAMGYGYGMGDGQPLTPTTKPRHFIAGLPQTPVSAPTSPGHVHSEGEYFTARRDTEPTTPQTPTVVLPPQRSSSETDFASSLTNTPKPVFASRMKGFLAIPSTPPVEPPVDPYKLLSAMRRTIQGTERKLYTQLAQTPVRNLNDVRRSFVAAAQGTSKRLVAWQRKHVPETLKGYSEKTRGVIDCVVGGLSLKSKEPEWWKKGCHAVPGGNVIVRENDWGSIIAFTLGTVDYQRELASMSLARPPSAATLPTPISTPSSDRTSFFSSLSGPAQRKFFSSSASSSGPDPDDQDVVWHEPEAYSAVIVRKAHPRDPTSLLSLRDVLRQRNLGTGLADGPLPIPRFGSLGAASGAAQSGSSSNTSGSATPGGSGGAGSRVVSGMRAKPAPVEVSMHAAGGEVSGLPMAGDVNATPGGGLTGEAAKILHEFECASIASASGSDASSISSSFAINSSIRRGKAASVISVESDATIGGGEKDKEHRESDVEGSQSLPPLDPTASVIAPAPPPKDDPSQPPIPPPKTASISEKSDQPATSTAGGSSFTSSITNSLANAMRFVLPQGSSTNTSQSRPNSPSPFKTHHGLLSSTDLPIMVIDERPHIKYDWTVGKRLKFSCTVYYAKQFDTLRRRCGIGDDVFLKSLERSKNWAAEGGKSKSNFWKTADERFIIKTLVNAWNVADLQVLLELAPSYFRYMESTAGRPSVLAKLVGFYTIEIRNLESGTVQSKADLLVMENLFYEQSIVKTFDLKGIQGRRVKASGAAPGASSSASANKTLFDGEWIEGQQRTLTLIKPHSKAVLQEALRSDAEFLAKSNIMDYSLLLGVDTSRKQIACGLVDTIGSYTFAKTLEYKAKQGLNSGKEVTVIPPAEYQERFVNALDGYFVACPDKWSKPVDGVDICDAESLPCVL